MCCRTMKIMLQHPSRTGKWLKIHLTGREHYILKGLKEYWELFVCLLWGEENDALLTYTSSRNDDALLVLCPIECPGGKLWRPLSSSGLKTPAFAVFYSFIFFLLDAGSNEALDPTAPVHCESCHLFWNAFFCFQRPFTFDNSDPEERASLISSFNFSLWNGIKGSLLWIHNLESCASGAVRCFSWIVALQWNWGVTDSWLFRIMRYWVVVQKECSGQCPEFKLKANYRNRVLFKIWGRGETQPGKWDLQTAVWIGFFALMKSGNN